MPFYDYKCLQCGHEFEKYESIKNDKQTACPFCFGEAKKNES